MSEPLRAFVLAHFEKVLFSGFAAWAALAASSAFGAADVDAVGGGVDARLAAVADYMASGSSAPAPTPPEWAQAHPLAAEVGDVDPLPGWVMHRRPGLVYELPPPLDPLELRHDPPALKAPAEGPRGRLALERAPARTRYAAVTGYAVERRVGADGAWEVAARLAPGARAWEEGVASRTRNAYRVVSRARLDREDPRVRQRGLRELPEPLRTRRSAARAVTTLPRFHVLPNQVEPASLPGGPDRAWLRVFRWTGDGWESRLVPATTAPEGRSGAGAFATGARLLSAERVEVAEPWPHTVARITVRYPSGEVVTSTDERADRPAELQDE